MSNTMSAEEFRATINRLGWTYEIAADRAGRSYSRFRKFASGDKAVDEPLVMWLRSLIAILDNPPATLERQAYDRMRRNILDVIADAEDDASNCRMLSRRWPVPKPQSGRIREADMPFDRTSPLGRPEVILTLLYDIALFLTTSVLYWCVYHGVLSALRQFDARLARAGTAAITRKPKLALPPVLRGQHRLHQLLLTRMRTKAQPAHDQQAAARSRLRGLTRPEMQFHEEHAGNIAQFMLKTYIQVT